MRTVSSGTCREKENGHSSIISKQKILKAYAWNKPKGSRSINYGSIVQPQGNSEVLSEHLQAQSGKEEGEKLQVSTSSRKSFDKEERSSTNKIVENFIFLQNLHREKASKRDQHFNKLLHPKIKTRL